MFDETISSVAELRTLVKAPSELAASKVINHIDDICREFIRICPFVMIASRGRDGRLDISPKGDPAGFVHVLDEKTLIIPDRPGNNRFDTFENLLEDPNVSLFFLIPGQGDTLRVSGKASLHRDRKLQQQLAINGKEPAFLMALKVEEAFLHCPKCVTRSKLWQSDSWPSGQNLPSLAQAVVTHSRLAREVSEVQAVIDEDAEKNLY